MKKHLLISLLGLFAFVGIASAQSYTFNTDLYLGSQGNDVANLQSFLISNGFAIPSVSTGAVPQGYFGLQTKAALAAYQNSVGINPTGYFGPQTRNWVNGHSKGSYGDPHPVGLTITSPNGGEVWHTGTMQGITWVNNSNQLAGQSGTIKLEYPTPACAQPGQVIRCMVLVRAPLTIATNINLSAGFYNWNVGASASNSGQNQLTDGQYRIQICSNDGSVCDESDNTFTIASETNPPSGYSPIITGVDAPTSLSVNQMGTWTIHATDPQNGYLSYSVDWGDYNCPLGYTCSANAPAMQSFVQQTTFTHSYSTAGTYTVKFTVRNQNGNTAQTSASVSVGTGSGGGAGPLRITSPNGGEVWQKGTNHTITWTSPYYFAAAYADLKVTQKYNCTTQICPMIAYAPYTIASGISINQNSYNWNVGTVTNYNGQSQTLPDGQYTIQICQTNSTSCDSSDNTFTITSSSGGGNSQITVLSPNGGEVWTANSIRQIAWSFNNSNYYSNAVDIYLGQNIIPPCIAIYPAPAACSGTFQSSYVLDRNVSSNTTYNWVVGTDINNRPIPAGTYSMEVCPAGSTSNCDVSNSPFTITGTAYPYYPASNTSTYGNTGGYYSAPTYGTSYGTGYSTGYSSNSLCPAGYVCTPVTTTSANYSY